MWIFGDSFDCYAAIADAVGYWDGSVGTAYAIAATGRFPGSQGIQVNSAPQVGPTKSSGSNDALHHISVAIQQTTTITGTNLCAWLQLLDGSTAQCTIVFRSDGAILLAQGGPTGTVLATYTGAVPVINTWYQFEFEIRVSNTAGFMNVRKLGNTSNDFSTATNLDTAGGTANDYANKLTVGANNAVTVQVLDDFLWRSDSVVNGVPWVGDIRCQTRRPASDAAVQWSPSGSVVPYTPFAQTTTTNNSINGSRYTPFVATCTGTIATVSAPVTTAITANVKCSIFASSGSAPTTVLGSATPLSGTIAVGTATWTFGTPVAVTQGTQYWIGIDTDTTSGVWGAFATGLGGLGATVTYASFPVANPSSLSASVCPAHTVNITPTAAVNAPFVADITQDAANSYVYSSTVGQSDLYGITSIATTPASIVAVTTRAYLQKSDAGTRIVRLQLKSGATTVQSSDVVLNTVFGWGAMTHTLDPATGLPWTAVGVNNLNIGVLVQA